MSISTRAAFRAATLTALAAVTASLATAPGAAEATPAHLPTLCRGNWTRWSATAARQVPSPTS